MSESEISQTHEGPSTEVPGGASPPTPPPSPQPAPARPQIGDTRPAPAAPVAPPPAPVVPAVAPIIRPPAFIGAADTSDTSDSSDSSDERDDEGSANGKRGRSRRRSGRDRKGKQVGRYLVCVHVQPAMTQIAMLEGRSLVEHYVSRAADDTNQIDGNVYRGPGPERAPGHGGRVRGHRDSEERRPLSG